MMRNEKYGVAVDIIYNQRERLLDGVNGAYLPCLACGKVFPITRLGSSLLYCCEAHAEQHKADVGDGTISFVYVDKRKESESCSIEK